MQILPAIDLRGGRCVRLQQGDYDRETVFSDDPIEVACRWADEGAPRLHLVDLDGAREGRPVNHDIVRRVAQEVGIPCQLGGGVRDESAIDQLLGDTGVDRVIVGTQALKQPEWFATMARKHPNRVALGLDVRDSMVATEGWLEVSKVSAIELAQKYVGLPLAAVIYTNIANDGMMKGIDDATIDDMLKLASLGFPVIASGGVTTLEDVRRLKEASRREPNLVGAIIGRALYEGTIHVCDAVGLATA